MTDTHDSRQLVLKAYFGRAHVYRLLGRFDMSESDLDTMNIISGSKEDMRNSLVEKANMHFRQGKTELCEQRAREAIALARKAKDRTTIAEANIPLAQAVRARGDYKEATELLEESIKIFSDIHDSNGLFRAQRIYTHMLSSKGQFDKAIEILSGLVDKHGDSISLLDRSSILTNLATCYSQIGDLDKAIQLYYDAIKMKEMMGDKVGMSICYYSLSYTLYYKCDFDKALECANKSLGICLDIEDISGISYAYISIASINKKLGNFNTAIEYHEKSLEVGKPMNDLHMELSNLTDLGFLYSDTGDYENAERVIRELADKTANLDNPYYKCSLLKLRISYLDNKDDRKELRSIAEEGLKMAEQSKMKSDYYHFLSELLAESDKPDEALYNRVFNEAYKSDNISFKVVAFPAVIKYNLDFGDKELALKVAVEYSELMKSLNEISHSAEALYLTALANSSLGLDDKAPYNEAMKLSKKLGLKPLVKKLKGINTRTKV